MAKVLIDTKIYFKGNSQIIPAGTVFDDNAEIVLKNKDKFVFEDKKEHKTQTKEVKKPAKNRKVKKEEPKEELLIEAPVSELDVEIKEETTK